MSFDLNELLQNNFDLDHDIETLRQLDDIYDVSEDKKVLKAIIEDIKKYDVFDFISKLSSLNLLIENQNKSILFDALINAVLSIPIDQYSSNAKISNSKFRKIIEKIEQLGLSVQIDPAENAFIERVQYYGNYWIFPGINYSPGYTLQGFINVLCLRKNNFDKEFIIKANRLIYFILFISNSITKQLGYGKDTLDHIEKTRINIPNAFNIGKLQNCIYINNKEIEDLLSDDELISSLYIEFGSGDLDISISDTCIFFNHPFLHTNKNRTIILNPSIMIPFSIHQLVLLADNYGIKDEVINAYNNEIWGNCRRSLAQIGHKKILEANLGIELFGASNYKEIILNVENDQLLIVHFICDDGFEYSQESMFHQYSKDISNIISKRINYMTKKLALVPSKNIYRLFILNSFGRRIGFSGHKVGVHTHILLSPYELLCVSINERNVDAFLPRYIISKDALNRQMSIPISELNSIEIYTSNNYSFYISDKFNPKTMTLFVAPGDSLDYILKAIKQEDRQLIESYDGRHLLEVILNDETRNIYIPVNNSDPKAELAVKFKNVIIWIYSPEIFDMNELNIYFSTVDAISFWLAECRKIIENLEFKYETRSFCISLTGNISDYGLDIKDEITFDESIVFEDKSSCINMIWNPSTYRLLNIKTNEIEKSMMKGVLSQLQKKSKNSVDWKQLDKVFINPLKKKFFTLDYTNAPYLKPVYDRFQRIRAEDENLLLDDIGHYFLEKGPWSYGMVPDEQRVSLGNAVVGYLYSELQKMVAAVKSEGLFELVCNDLEISIYNLMLLQKRFAYDIACYPEKESKIQNDYNEINKSSLALKFLAEYIAACPSDGQQILGKMQYEKMLTICSMIIDWAYRNDLFKFNIFKTPIEFLESGRIGMKIDEFNVLTSINLSARKRNLESISNPYIDRFFPNGIMPNLQSKVDDAFFDEYGYTFDQFTRCIMYIIEYGDRFSGDVKNEDRKVLIREISTMDNDLDEAIISSILEQISLSEREDFLKPTSPYIKTDVLPWRFNRELSFTRRPILNHGSNVIWGNRQLYHMWVYTIDLIIEGKYKARNMKLSSLIGKLADKRGNEFNDMVAERLSSFNGLIVDKKVSKINKIKILGKDKNELGDIDVLYIVPTLKKIVIAEVKDFSFAKNPYEMDQEYQRMFVDKEKELCYVSKHRRRVAWAVEHIEDIKVHYRLSEGKWTIKDTFFVSEEIISNIFHKKGQSIITYSEMAEKVVKSV